MRRMSLFLLAASLIAAPAAAEPRRNLTMTRVAVGDLDLETEAGAAAMLRRIKSASRELCALPRSEMFPNRSGLEWKCRRQAMDAAVERLQAPKLALAYAEWISAEPAVEPPSPRYR
ncbi:UrcA family protein [Phenylobacterium sp.]|uniref:UrcA family protein n=1 Tax=Phenylobacterium sp. TaxID=1871053 RepID=UPI0025F528B8|nr:UrcA family protein [Phenylobacterium sp.]